ncbi:hypothetical protein CLOSTMETH_03865 [[Clostridium] methylpentosum DSM 5476]|uniref:Uncharacterized protein n=1 Tax=[Clostridium] methylpentosum DSM 5476 TaxID=537013 RepID=C0EJ19_9FIRM|nr:hypothetical protein CLOSTMETH_03865 [[Clostridium] methylpentosum DSM 5476]
MSDTKDKQDREEFCMKEKKNKQSQQRDRAQSERNKKEKIPSDVLGSYTGVPQDGEKPEQDADDL